MQTKYFCFMKQFVTIIITAIFLSLSSFAQDYGPHEPEKFSRISTALPPSTKWVQMPGTGEWMTLPSDDYNEYYKKLPNNSYDRHNTKVVWGYFAIDIVSFNDNDGNPVYAIRYKIGDVKYTMFDKMGGEYSYHYDLFYITKDDLERIAYLENDEQIVVYPYGNDPYSESEDGYIQHYRMYGPSYPSLPQPGRIEWTITKRDGKKVVRFTLPYEAFSQLDAVLEYGPYYELEYKYFRRFQHSVRKLLKGNGGRQFDVMAVNIKPDLKKLEDPTWLLNLGTLGAWGK